MSKHIEDPWERPSSLRVFDAIEKLVEIFDSVGPLIEDPLPSHIPDVPPRLPSSAPYNDPKVTEATRHGSVQAKSLIAAPDTPKF